MARAEAVAARLPVDVDVEHLLTVRAELAGLASRGRTSAGGSCRLLPAEDGWVAVNLARLADVEALPAVVEAPVDGPADADPWSTAARFVADRPALAAADRFQLLEVPAAALGDPRVDAARHVVVDQLGEPAPAVPRTGLVVDLSAMWAGPLCTHLLGRAGHAVVKVESVDRPDGARAGNADFFTWLHEGHEQVTLDLRTVDGRAALTELLDRADVVVESSRPRALAQLGVTPEAFLGSRPGRTWVSITGYGRTGPDASRVAFGDDAAVAGGLVARDERGDPFFCGDAVADPLSGLVAAAAAWDARAAGGGRLVAVAMAAVARALAGERERAAILSKLS